VTEARVRETDTAAASLKPSGYNHYTDTADPERSSSSTNFGAASR
jgi:hypothetical protein